jgi:2-keto-3-deoxy-L-rhamnonate aldolase RhmA
MKRSNHLRELLKAGKPSLGTRLHSSWPTIIELVGYSSMFDYVEILAEYAPYNLFSLENQGRAIDLFENFTGMIKIAQESRRELAVKAMNAGIQNVLFADVRTVADVEECIKTVRAESMAAVPAPASRAAASSLSARRASSATCPPRWARPMPMQRPSPLDAPTTTIRMVNPLVRKRRP